MKVPDDFTPSRDLLRYQQPSCGPSFEALENMAELLPAGPVLRVEPHDGQEEGGHPGAGAGHLLGDVAQPGGEQDREEDGDGHEQPEEQVGLRCNGFVF